MEQYNQILRLLNRPQLNETSANANMTGILASSSSLINAHPTHSQWIVDSGATNHMVNDNSIFNTGLTVARTGKVQIPTDDNVLKPIFHPTKIAEEFPIARLGECDIEPLIDSIENETMVEAASSVDSVEQPPVRRTSTRISKPPIWQKDFITKTCSKTAEGIVIVLIYVDDLLITGSSKRLIDNAKQVLKDNFKIKDLGDLRYFLGIEFARNSQGILMHQRKYAMELISDSGMSGSKPCVTPVEVNQKLTTSEFDDHFKLDNGNDLLDSGEYQRLVGRLLYLTITRPDIAFAVQSLSQFMHAPKSSHMEAALRVVKYVKQAPGFGILMSAKPTNILQGFCDADWGSCINSRRSITGYMIMFGNSLISWKSKKQPTVSRSSAEAEYRSLASTVAEVIWLIGMFRELGVEIELPENQVQATIFSTDITYFEKEFAPFKTYLVSVAYVKVLPLGYENPLNKFVWTLDKNTIVEPIEEVKPPEDPLPPPTRLTIAKFDTFDPSTKTTTGKRLQEFIVMDKLCQFEVTVKDNSGFATAIVSDEIAEKMLHLTSEEICEIYFVKLKYFCCGCRRSQFLHFFAAATERQILQASDVAMWMSYVPVL
uniref:Reverse transcriptase Ty1/copia-type domain-containing protein n=1 Tax=Solanum lycopersicum TaxID=4081 RepID=A0A3Q7G6D1_SOLLC